MGFSLKDWRGVRRQSRGLVYMASPYLAGALPTAFLGWLGKKSVTTGRWDWRGADRDVVWKRANSSSLDTKKPFCYQSLEGKWQSEESLFTAHTHGSDWIVLVTDFFGPWKPRRGRRSVWGELLMLICSKVKLCEWFVLHNLWSVTCCINHKWILQGTSLWSF